MHQRDLIVAHGVLGIHEWVMMWEVDLMLEEVGRQGEGLRDVAEHVHHGLVDTGTVRAAVDPLAILREGREVE